MAILWNDVETRARLIGEKARRMLDCEDDWGEYCAVFFFLCAIELAREQVDEEHGWAATEEARAVGDEAMRLAHQWVGGTEIQERTCS